MLKPYLIALLLLLVTTAGATNLTGFRQTTLNVGGARPLHVSLWYPTAASGSTESIGENRAFYGINAQRDAAPTTGTHALVVLSHGYGGNWRNLNWLADQLAQQGYIVAAPDHPGTTTMDRNPATAAQLWERPRDLTRVIDLLLDNPALAGRVDSRRIAAIGHSLGGWTVMALAGARFDCEQFINDCQTNPQLIACKIHGDLGIGRTPDASASLDSDLADTRVKAVVSLDLGLARGFTPPSLAALNKPVLLIGVGTDINGLPSKQESGYLAANLPVGTARYVQIADATHFSFMQSCKPGAAALIEADAPGEGIVCRDGTGRDRAAIHQQVAGLISAFLIQAIPST